MVEPLVAEVTPAHFPDIAARVARIDDAARAVDGHPALGDAVWLDLEHRGAHSAGFFAGDDAYAHVAPGDNAEPKHWMLGIAIAPRARDHATRAALVAAAVRHVGAHGGGRIVLWLLGATAADDAELAETGLRPARDLYEMRVALPLGERASWPPHLLVRPFEVGRDEAAWLAVNNRAFADHAEQGGWSRETFARRITEPWFDPALFLLAFDADGLLGFDWLKVHAPHDRDPELGEIYVIGVDPRGQGLGLGRALAVAGLDAVHERGITTGMLFCAADNEPALKLYRALGFTVHRTDRAYECEVDPQ